VFIFAFGQSGTMIVFRDSSQYTFASPAMYVTGVWTITKITATDSFGNVRTYTGAELTALAPGGLTITVNQPASPTTNPIDLVSYVHAPAAVDVTPGSVSVKFNATVAGTYTSSTRPIVRVYLSSPDARCSAKSYSAQFVEVQGANSVFQATQTLSSSSMCNGNYGVAGVSIDDAYGSRSVYGSCPSGTSGSQSSNCQDPRVDSTGSAATATAQASLLLVALAAVFAALMA
jgi:hypothetical protein